MTKKIKWESGDCVSLEDYEKVADKMVELGHLPPKEHSERIEFLSRQHIDFKTPEGMKKLLQAVTWRVKIEKIEKTILIHVRKKKIPEVRRLAKEFGVPSLKYEVHEIKWNECWFKRFQYFDHPKWELINTTELLESLEVGDEIKYAMHIDQKPYKKGTIRQIETPYHIEGDRKPTRLYIAPRIKHYVWTDMLLLNCTTGYDIPYKDRSYKLFLYRKRKNNPKLSGYAEKYGVMRDDWCVFKQGSINADRVIFTDPASKDGDYSAEILMTRKLDGSVEVIDSKVVK